MITTPVIVVIVKIRSEIFRTLDLQGIDFCTRKIIPVIDIIGKYATSKLDGVILTDGAEFFRSIIVFRNEYFMLHIDSAETNRREGMPWIKDFLNSVKLFFSILVCISIFDLWGIVDFQML